MNIRSFVAATLALSLCACGSVQPRQDYRQSMAPIEVIEGNFVESTHDAEIVFTETPWQAYAGKAALTAA